ncbi:DUF3142 domain-containing protein, partial [Salmonella enterica subsp. enterica]|nr:DUF3142 domain-containing protein [Salmonella enterica subsp. enterica]
IHHKPLTPRWSLIISPQADKQLIDLAIKNSGDIDAPLPQQIELPATQCTYADGAGHYQAQTNASSLRFIRISTRQLRTGESSALGWARCTPNLQGEFNVIP